LAPHEVPSASVGLEHVPVLELHVPGVWHGAGAGQATGFEPVQIPFWQASVRLHALSSLHEVPVVGVQAPVVFEQTEHPAHAVPVFCQAPLVSHVCG
jgi:hypothetical protein